MRKRIDRLQDPLRYLGIVMALMGALALLTLPAYNYTFDFMAWATARHANRGWLHRLQYREPGHCAGIMLPATFCAGMTLPLLTHSLLNAVPATRNRHV